MFVDFSNNPERECKRTVAVRHESKKIPSAITAGHFEIFLVCIEILMNEKLLDFQFSKYLHSIYLKKKR